MRSKAPLVAALVCASVLAAPAHAAEHRLRSAVIPETAPPTIRPMPRMVISRLLVWSRAMRALSAAIWPPVMCPVSWAITPIISSHLTMPAP